MESLLRIMAAEDAETVRVAAAALFADYNRRISSIRMADDAVVRRMTLERWLAKTAASTAGDISMGEPERCAALRMLADGWKRERGASAPDELKLN